MQRAVPPLRAHVQTHVLPPCLLQPQLRTSRHHTSRPLFSDSRLTVSLTCSRTVNGFPSPPQVPEAPWMPFVRPSSLRGTSCEGLFPAYPSTETWVWYPPVSVCMHRVTFVWFYTVFPGIHEPASRSWSHSLPWAGTDCFSSI